MKLAILSILVLSLVAANVQAKALSLDTTAPNGQNFGSALEMFIMAFRKMMPCGSTSLGIPVMAPFTVPNYTFQYNTQYLKVDANFSNIVIGGLNSYQVLGASYDTNTNHLTYDFMYPEIQILTENTMNIWALLAGFPVQMDVQGLNNVRVTDFRFVGSFDVEQNPANPNGLRINNFNMNFYIGDIVFNNWNNLWNIAANNFVNKWARDAVLMWAEQIQGEVDAIYDKMVLPLVNDALADVNMTQVIDFFEQEAQLFSSVDCTLSGNNL